MKRFLCTALAAVVLGVGALSGPVLAQATDPAAVARATIDAENAHNVDLAVSMFAANAVVNLPTGQLTTRAQIEQWQRDLAAGNFRAVTNTPTVTGDRVTFSGNIALDTFRNLGLATLDSNWDLTVVAGKITVFTFNFTPDAAARLGAAIAAAQAPSQPTDPASVARALIAAENAHNVDAAVNFFGPSAVVTLPTGVLTSRAEITQWQRELAAGNFHAEINTPAVTGENVKFSGNIALDTFRNLGLATLDATWELNIQLGKVTTFTFNFTPAAGARLQAALAGGGTAAATPARASIAFTGSNLRDDPLLPLAAAASLLLGVVLVLVAAPVRRTARR